MIEKKRKSISFSEYSTYMQCPHRWYLNYFLRMPSETNEELIFGSVVHATIETLLRDKLQKKLYTVMPEQTVRNIFKNELKKELQRVVDIPFLANFNKKELGNIFMFQASKLITILDFFRRFDEYEIVEVEVKLDGLPIVSTDEVDIVYKGFVDLILRNKRTGKYLILDWKTSGKAWDIVQRMKDKEDFFAQLCLYKHYYSSIKGLKFNEVETKFYNLPRSAPEKQSPYQGQLTQDYTENFFDRFKKTSMEIYQHTQQLGELKKQKFITKKNFCNRCTFNIEKYCNSTDEYQIVLDENGQPMKPTPKAEKIIEVLDEIKDKK